MQDSPSGPPPETPDAVPPSAPPGPGAVSETVWPPPGKVLSPAAKRALAEAEARRQAAKTVEEEAARNAPKEINGREGPDPVRYGDWELKGIISDF